MGAWGTAIFSDDTALDIRDEWRDAILDGLSTGEATARLVKSFEDTLREGEDTEKLFWIALAAAQFETGRLLPEIGERALEIIDAGGDVARWREDGDEVLARQRARVLQRLASKLRGPRPKPKRLRRQPAFSVPFDVGDVVRVHDEAGEQEALVVVVGHVDLRDERDPVVAALDWDGGSVPDPDTLARLSVLPDPYAPDRQLLIWVTTTSKKEVFGPHLGEVVAKSVSLDEPVDSDRMARSMNWRLVRSSVQEAQAHARET
jgi:hypothetical protein